ncbi:DNA repair protein RecO [Lentilactobacillus sp. Marseille-Q4993]|uniref:DNA repair protein RecO n=1 Tax=Lentilactobacillus sp. Marseille-Q4993 TaxID=3039492 RepID=UPI0024BCAFD7|nr:DNA repair protein RecO [Lentilactobacillus sp. Marseille-Q4993]
MKGKITDFSGIILYTKPYRDNDLLVKFLTKQFGKKMFFVRGAKRPKFKMRAAIMPFTTGEYTGDIRDSGLSYIGDPKSYRMFQNIAEDITRNAYATYIMSLIDMAFPDGVPQPEWYSKLLTGLKLIDSGYDSEIITNIFEVQLLSSFGVEPDWRDCAVCHRTDLPFDYSEAYGGLLCSNHWQLDRYRMHLPAKTIYLLRLFSVVDLNKLGTIDVSDDTKKNLRLVIDKIYSETVGIYPKSKKFLDQLGKFKL